MNAPVVSVIVPVYNGERFLREALESSLNQDYPPFEVIVVDDGSTDNTATIAKSYQAVRYIYQENRGASAARNAGIAAARGDLIAFLDADDLWPSDRLSLQAGFHEANPEVGYSVGRHRAFLEPDVTKPSWLRARFLTGNEVGYFQGTLMARKKVFDTIGCFDSRYRGTAGGEWFVRAKDAGIRKSILPHLLLFRRIHGENLSYDDSKTLNANIVRILKESLDRRKSAKGGPGRES